MDKKIISAQIVKLSEPLFYCKYYYKQGINEPLTRFDDMLITVYDDCSKAVEYISEQEGRIVSSKDIPPLDMFTQRQFDSNPSLIEGFGVDIFFHDGDDSLNSFISDANFVGLNINNIDTLIDKAYSNLLKSHGKEERN